MYVDSYFKLSLLLSNSHNVVLSFRNSLDVYQERSGSLGPTWILHQGELGGSGYLLNLYTYSFNDVRQATGWYSFLLCSNPLEWDTY